MHTMTQYERWRAQGKCWRCGQPVVSDRVRCAPCAAINAAACLAHQRRWRQAARCPNCGGTPVPGRVCCAACAKDSALRQWRLNAEE